MQCNDKTLSDGESVEVQMLISSSLFCTLCGSFTSSFRPHHRVFFSCFFLWVYLFGLLLKEVAGLHYCSVVFLHTERNTVCYTMALSFHLRGFALAWSHAVGKRLLVYVTVQLFSCIPRGIQFVTQWPCLSTLGVLLFLVT